MSFQRKFLIPAYIYCDKDDPNMLTFLNPLIEKLNSLNDPGIHVPDSADRNINVRCMLFVATADLPAQADMVNKKRFNANVLATFASQKERVMGPTTSTDAGLFNKTLRKRLTKIS